MDRTLPFLLALSLSAAPVSAVDGDLDTAFAEGGSTIWQIVHDFFEWDVETSAVVPGDDRLYLVGTRSLTGDHLAFRALDTAGGKIVAASCEQTSTGSIFPFGVESRALAAGLSDSGKLLVAGAITIQGSESIDRAFVARFDPAGGCALDDGFATDGWAIYDDFSFCDTESCSVLGLAQIRRSTLAVSATRIILLVRSETGGVKGRLFLVGLTANGAVDNGFDGNGVLEILADGTDGFYGEAQLAVDARGRIYVLATPFKEGGVTDTDLYLFRYLPGGGLDTCFSGDGVIPLQQSNSVDSTADDLKIASDGTVLTSAATIGGSLSFVRGTSADGSSGAIYTESLMPEQLAPQGDGLMVTNAEFPPEGADGFRTHRRHFGITSDSFDLDPGWGSGGTADHDFDSDPGSVEGDNPRHLELWNGRPVIAGRAVANADVSFAMRLESRYVFADGFEQGRASLWSQLSPP